MVRFFKILLISILLMGIGQAQYSEYYIHSIGVIGTNHVDRSQVLRISGLDKQDEITADGTSQAVKDLWASGWFSDIKIYAIDPTEESIDLVIQIEENPMTELSRDIDFNFEADHLYCYLSAVCSKELFDAIVERFNK